MLDSMFITAGSPSPTVGNPHSKPLIELPFNAAAIKLFMNQTHNSKPEVVAYDNQTTAAIQYRDLIRVYECDGLLSLEKRAFEDWGDRKPMDLLKLAASKDDIELGKTALRKTSNPNNTQKDIVKVVSKFCIMV